MERKGEATFSARNELESAFEKKRDNDSKLASTSKKAKRAAWKHQFVCLAYCQQKKVPTTKGEREKLFEAELGRKEIEFPTLEMDASAFREVLYEAYPKLREGGGFRLCRCIPNSRELEPLSMHVLSSPHLLKEMVGQARTYIVPLQRDLDLTPSVDIPGEVREDKWTCEQQPPCDDDDLLPSYSQTDLPVLIGAASNQQPPSSGAGAITQQPPLSSGTEATVVSPSPTLHPYSPLPPRYYHISYCISCVYLRLEISEHNLAFKQ